MISGKNKRIINAIQKLNPEYETMHDLFDMARAVFQEDEHELKYALKLTKYIREVIPCLPADESLNELYWNIRLWEAPYLFESFLLYMEKNRSPKKKFYEPRAKTLKIVADDLQDLEDGVIEFYGLSLPPRVGKSTICIFFLAWIAGRNPNLHSAMGGHSGILAKGFYKEFLNLITSPEYTYNEIFPDIVVENKSADEFTVNLNDPDRFATLTCRGIDGTWTGAVDISAGGYLYVDDLIRDRTESLSPTRLENRYQDYLNVMVDRKNDGAKELMVATRWNVLDPLGRNEEKFKGNPKARFRKIPALNENDESNFDYDFGLGFSTKYYKELRDRLDKNEWMAKYQQKPFIREGLLFPEDELNFYNGVLPDGQCLKAAACDVAWGGGDSLSMPFGEAFGDTNDGPVYISDWIFNKGDKYITKPIVAGKTMHNKPNMVRFEANNGGDEYAEDIDRILKENGFKTNISWAKADNKTSKMAKIIQYAPDIKRRFYFLKPELQSQEYREAMDELCMIVQIGKNEHDDAPDGLVQLLQLITGENYAKCKAMQRPF